MVFLSNTYYTASFRIDDFATRHVLNVAKAAIALNRYKSNLKSCWIIPVCHRE